jgi:hypothetical protein
MVRSTGSQPRVIVKRRGSKWHAADAESLRDLDASRRDGDGGMERATEAGSGEGRGGRWGAGSWGDERSLDPGRDRQAPVLAQ